MEMETSGHTAAPPTPPEPPFFAEEPLLFSSIMAAELPVFWLGRLPRYESLRALAVDDWALTRIESSLRI